MNKPSKEELKLAFQEARFMNEESFSEVLNGIDFRDSHPELIVAYMMSCNAHYGLGHKVRDTFAGRCRDFFKEYEIDLFLDPTFMCIFREAS